MTIARGFGICQMSRTSQTEKSIIENRKEADVMHHIPTIGWWKSRI